MVNFKDKLRRKRLGCTTIALDGVGIYHQIEIYAGNKIFAYIMKTTSAAKREMWQTDEAAHENEIKTAVPSCHGIV